MLRRRRQERRAADSGPSSAGAEPLSGPWRQAVDEAVAARSRFGSLVAGVPAGPLHDRLGGIDERLAGAVSEITALATRAQQVEAAVTALDAGDVTGQLKEARRRLAAAPEGPDAERHAAAVEALSAQHASLSRMRNAVEEAERRLRLLDLRVDAAVAQAAELALLGERGDPGPVERELQGVVDELSALRSALAEVS